VANIEEKQKDIQASYFFRCRASLKNAVLVKGYYSCDDDSERYILFSRSRARKFVQGLEM
jgi:hypothetical protein